MRLRNYWKNDDVDVPDEHAMQLLHLYVTLTKQAQVTWPQFPDEGMPP